MVRDSLAKVGGPGGQGSFPGTALASSICVSVFALVRMFFRRRNCWASGDRGRWRAGVIAAALSAYVANRLRRGLVGFQPLAMNPRELELSTEVEARRIRLTATPLFGSGVPDFDATDWRKHLSDNLSAHEVLVEVRNIAGLVKRSVSDMTLDQAAQGLCYFWDMRRPGLRDDMSRYLSEAQARQMATTLAAEAGISLQEDPESVREVVPRKFLEVLPPPPPRWVDGAQRISFAVLRAIFHMYGLQTRYVETEVGQIHVYDSGEPVRHFSDCTVEPPCLLQHGLFTTGWSVAILGLFLHRRRRVIIPDLQGFEYGYSRSSGGSDVYSIEQHALAVAAVVRDLAVPQVDLIGHSYGGMIVRLLAQKQKEYGITVRKLVMLCPAGPTTRAVTDAVQQRFVNLPSETMAESLNLPRFLLPLLTLLRNVMFSRNNINFLMGINIQKYQMQRDASAVIQSPTLLLWGQEDEIAAPRSKPQLQQHLREYFPKLEAYWVAGGGHNIQVIQVLTVAKAVQAFLDGRGHARMLETQESRPPTYLLAPLLFTRFLIAGTQGFLRGLSSGKDRRRFLRRQAKAFFFFTEAPLVPILDDDGRQQDANTTTLQAKAKL
eukprot:TRINITY_DN24735_c0_g1_i1.p1 TRINITY_DN24735_c0_g1~~TRINITY_DN24735_c0_g1_i1.p1  ORF type:complete len:605 (+),score=108.16 TRINITY_DN24735_c0_g1_i1:98-1912(+)